MPGRAGRVAKIAALLVSIGLAIAGGEVAVRVFFSEEVDTEILRSREEAQFQLAGIVQASSNPELLFELKRGYYGNWIDVLVATNPEAPARISTFAPPPSDPAVRIALIGDSTPFGHGLQYESSYPSILRVMLENSFGIPIELRNFSVPTYNSTQERVIFETEVAPWSPDLIIYHYDHNDPDPPTEDPYTQLPPAFGDNPLGSALIKFARRRIRAKRLERAQLEMNERDGAGAHFLEGHRHAGPRYDTHLEEIRRMGEGAARLGIPAVALIFDWGLTPFDNSADDPHYALLHQPLVPRLAAAGFIVLDMYPEYQKLMKERGWPDLGPFWLRPDHRTHPNEAGHFFLAGRLHDFILNTPELNRLLNQAAVPSPDPATANRVAAATKCYAGFLRLSQNEFGEAEKLLRDALAYNAADAGARMKLARALILQNRLPEAVAELEEVVSLKPDYAWAHLDLGDLYAHQGLKREAIVQYEIVLKINAFADMADKAAGLMAGLLTELAESSAAAGNRDEAIRFIDRAVTIYQITGQGEKVAELDELSRKLNLPGPPAK